MGLRERLIWAVLGSVGTTAALVVGATQLAQGSGLEVAYQGVAVLLAAAMAGVWAYVGVVVPSERQRVDLLSRLRVWSGSGERRQPTDPDPDLEELDDTVFDMLEALDRRASQMRRRVAMIGEAIHASHVGIGLLDDEGRFTEVNDTMRGMFRLRGEPVGKRPLEAVPSVEVHLVVEDARHQGTAERMFSTESSDLWARADRLTHGVFLRVEDVTGRREAERARTDFVANVSHELRTPLTAILGYLETILQDEARIPDDLVGMLQIVFRNTRRLRDLFEDLLRLHRIEARRRELPMEMLLLRPLLEEATTSAADRAHMRGQEFVLSCPGDLRAWVNPDALSAIVSNLAVNASTYSPDGGRVEVRVTRSPGGVLVEVRDDGVGIAAAHHERIFERFYRVDPARSSREGTGLGLAIVKHYALACGFHLSLDSGEGRGSVFRVLIPPAPAP